MRDLWTWTIGMGMDCGSWGVGLGGGGQRGKRWDTYTGINKNKIVVSTSKDRQVSDRIISFNILLQTYC